MARWHFCNVLLAGAQSRQLWQFNAGGNKFNLLRQESKLPNEPLSEKIVAKDWQSYPEKVNPGSFDCWQNNRRPNGKRC